MIPIQQVYYLCVNPEKNMNRIVESFDELMLDYMAGTLSDEGQRQLHGYLQSDEKYRQRFKAMARNRAKSLVGKFEQEKWTAYEALSAQLGLTKPAGRRTVRLTWRTAVKVAAAVLLLFTTSLSGYFLYRQAEEAHLADALCQMEVPLGSQTKVTLPDGSVVCLNSGSILKYAPDLLRKENREVYLEGEGYFEVQADAEKPFIVHVDKLNVKVLGTQFNVRSYHEDPEVEVSLIKGKVNVFSTSETQGNLMMKPDDMVTYDKRSGRMELHRVDAADASRWTMGRMSFVNASVADIVKTLERRYNVRILLQSKQFAQEIFSGSIDASLSIEEILDYLDVEHRYVWSRQGNVITIRDK